MLQLLGLGISMFEVWALRIRWDRRRCIRLFGFGPLLCLKEIILRLNFVLLFFFLANHAVEISSPCRERLHLGYWYLLKVFLLLLELLLFIVQILGSLYKIAIVGLQFVYFLLSFSISLVFLVDLLLQLGYLLTKGQLLELSGRRLDRRLRTLSAVVLTSCLGVSSRRSECVFHFVRG